MGWGRHGTHRGRDGWELFGQEGMHILDVLKVIVGGGGVICMLPFHPAGSLIAHLYTCIKGIKNEVCDDKG